MQFVGRGEISFFFEGMFYVVWPFSKTFTNVCVVVERRKKENLPRMRCLGKSSLYVRHQAKTRQQFLLKQTKHLTTNFILLWFMSSRRTLNCRSFSFSRSLFYYLLNIKRKKGNLHHTRDHRWMEARSWCAIICIHRNSCFWRHSLGIFFLLTSCLPSCRSNFVFGNNLIKSVFFCLLLHSLLKINCIKIANDWAYYIHYYIYQRSKANKKSPSRDDWQLRTSRCGYNNFFLFPFKNQYY